ncbi:MAG: hypothetical protein IJV24_04145 [Prevotella sp.]|nr:hypothetical protein [Prevotella sp.]
MKKSFTLFMLMLLTVFLAPTAVDAQDITLEGYTNVYIRVQAAIEGSGRVSVTPPSGGLETYKETVDFQKTLPVAMSSVSFNVKCRANSGYTYGGLYVDDGDGVFDITKDELISTSDAALVLLPLSTLGLGDDYQLYATETEAQMGEKPTEAQVIIFANFSNGVTIAVDRYQEQCGTVEISKPVNAAGDVVTIKAIPAEGYQFEYWKTGYGSQWGAPVRDTSVSSEAEWTFTVQGGERYYAYFSAIDAPVLEFPEEGGWIAASFTANWLMHEQSEGISYCLTMDDIVTNDAMQTYLDIDNDDAKYDNIHRFINAERGYGNRASLVYGKGKVRFTHYIPGLGFDRVGNILEWSGTKPYTVNDRDNTLGYHVYVFRPDLEAFVRIGTTDSYEEVYTTSVTVPANTCYLCMEGFDLADPITGYIPEVIGLSPEAFDKAVAGVETVQTSPVIGRQTVFDLMGRKMGGTPAKGLYIREGKKFVIK